MAVYRSLSFGLPIARRTRPSSKQLFKPLACWRAWGKRARRRRESVIIDRWSGMPPCSAMPHRLGVTWSQSAAGRGRILRPGWSGGGRSGVANHIHSTLSERELTISGPFLLPLAHRLQLFMACE